MQQVLSPLSKEGQCWQVLHEDDVHWHMYRNNGISSLSISLQKRMVYQKLAEALFGWLS